MESIPEIGDDELDLEGNEGSSVDLSSIFGSAVQAAEAKSQRQQRRDAYQNLDEQQKFYITRYPEPLRPAAARTSGLISRAAQAQEIKARREIRIRNALSEVRQPARSGQQADLNDRMIKHERSTELRRIEALLKASETDFELWNVLETEVFSQIKKLEPPSRASRSDEPTTSPVRKRGRPKSKADDVEPVTTETIPAEPERIPHLAVIGPNYPSHCLLALRLMHDNFPTSPLALNILPTIKRLGPTSHVLGATTALYNELLSLQWLVYGNMRAMADLVTEMDEQGIEFDRYTWQVLEWPVWERTAVNKGERRKGVTALWGLEEMASGFARLSALSMAIGARYAEESATRMGR